MKIVHVITGLNTGGAEVALCRLLETLPRSQFEHTVVALGSEGALSARVRASGARLAHLGMKPGVPNPTGLLKLRRLIRKERPAVVQGWMYHANLAATLSAANMGTPVAWGIRHSLHDLMREKRLTRAVIRAGRALSGRPRAIVYNSTVSARQHEAYGYTHGKTRVIANGFDTEAFRPDAESRERIRSELGIGAETLTIGHVARWHPMKDHANLLRAASLFVKEWPNSLFVLVGDGMETGNTALMALVEQFGLDKLVRLCGRRVDVAAMDAAFDIASSSSSWGEAFPNAIGEAMACGVPCVATDVGDVREIVGDTGIVVPTRDPEALVAGWSCLAEMTPEARRGLGERARQRITERYTLVACANAYAAHYHDLAGA